MSKRVPFLWNARQVYTALYARRFILYLTNSWTIQFLQDIDIIHPTTGRANSTLILGTVKYIHVRNDVLNEKGLVDPAKFKPVARLGDITYASLGDGFRLSRPSWDTEGEKIEEAVKSVSE